MNLCVGVKNENFYSYRLRINHEPVMSLCVGIINKKIDIFDAKLRFALLFLNK